MKNFLKEVLKTTLSTYFASVVTGVGGVSSLIALFHDVSGYYVIYLCALLLFLSWYCFYLSKQNKANTKREETNIKVTKCSSVTSLKERTFNILAIDDQYKTRQYLKENFQSECLTVIEAIPTPLFAEGFDIIISDLIGAGPGKKENATQILQGIRKRYPYKYLIIMSSEPLLLVEVAQWADATITKTETDSLYEKLSVALLKAKEELSNPKKRWENLKVQGAILQDSYNKEEEYSLFLASHHPSTLIK